MILKSLRGTPSSTIPHIARSVQCCALHTCLDYSLLRRLALGMTWGGGFSPTSTFHIPYSNVLLFYCSSPVFHLILILFRFSLLKHKL
jgi:hypothetical protein